MKQQTASVWSVAIEGMQTTPVEVEVHSGSGIPMTLIVGLPDSAVTEARDRVRSAFLNQGLGYPRKRVTINLAPADVKKRGTLYDVPIAIAILAAEREVSVAPDLLMIGELALDGRTRPVSGALVMADDAIASGKSIILPLANAEELSLLDSDQIFLADSLLAIVQHCRGELRLPTVTEWNKKNVLQVDNEEERDLLDSAIQLEGIQGQAHAKHALVIAATGGHNILLSGPPGTGKTMLARAAQFLLPPLARDEQRETMKLYSILSSVVQISTTRPFRAPHHTASAIAIIGGGTALRPGELSLAHNGILFLDELPEFRRDVIEALRQPLETGEISLSRASGSAVYPCRAMVIAAMNPCPCGFAGAKHYGDAKSKRGEKGKECRCTDREIERYQKKISGPLLDRFDLKINVGKVEMNKLLKQKESEKKESVTESKSNTAAHYAQSSEIARTAIQEARQLQQERQGKLNAFLTAKEVKEFCVLTEESEELLYRAVEAGVLSMRGFHKVQTVARTLADLEKREKIQLSDVALAMSVVQRQQ